MDSDHNFIVVIGGSGLVGEALASRWDHHNLTLRYFIHRSEPEWLARLSVDHQRVDLNSAHEVMQAALGAKTVINLLRPSGDGQYPELLSKLLPALKQAGVLHVVHASTIDVYSGSPQRIVDESTLPMPRNSYESEHLAAEKVVRDTFDFVSILRLGAVFGPGGKNIAALAKEMAQGSRIKPLLRRALNGRRRMHLVSLSTVTSALKAASTHPLDNPEILANVTDDRFEDNNFGFVQDQLARAFQKPLPAVVFYLPQVFLRLSSWARCMPPIIAHRRFRHDAAHELGVQSGDFPSELASYIRTLPATEHRK